MKINGLTLSHLHKSAGRGTEAHENKPVALSGARRRVRNQLKMSYLYRDGRQKSVQGGHPPGKLYEYQNR